jgi:hypothetical protein
VNSQVFGEESEEQQAESEGAMVGSKRFRMIKIEESHLKNFGSSDGILMISPFLPEGLKDCEWCASVLQ